MCFHAYEYEDFNPSDKRNNNTATGPTTNCPALKAKTTTNLIILLRVLSKTCMEGRTDGRTTDCVRLSSISRTAMMIINATSFSFLFHTTITTTNY